MAMLLRLALLFFLVFPGVGRAASWTLPPPEAQPVDLSARPPVPGEFIGVEGVYASVYAHPRDAVTLQRLADYAATTVPRIAERLGVGTGPAMRIVIADEAASFAAMQPGATPVWADGTAWPNLALIYLRSPRIRPGTASPLEVVLDHEIAHVLIGQAYHGRPVPAWLQEGVAQWVAGEFGPQTVDELARALARGTLVDIRELVRGFPQDPVRARAAYAQSVDLINVIASEQGEAAIPALLGRMAAGEPVYAAVRAVTGRDIETIDAARRAELRESGLWLRALAQDGSWMALGGPILFFGWLGARRRNRARLDRWREDEAARDRVMRQTYLSLVVDPRVR